MLNWITLCLAFQLVTGPLTHDLHLSGKVYFKDEARQERVEGLHFFVRCQKEIIAEDIVGEGGTYSLTVPMKQSFKKFDFYFAGNDFDTCFVKSISRFESDVAVLDFQLD